MIFSRKITPIHRKEKVNTAREKNWKNVTHPCVEWPDLAIDPLHSASDHKKLDELLVNQFVSSFDFKSLFHLFFPHSPFHGLPFGAFQKNFSNYPTNLSFSLNFRLHTKKSTITIIPSRYRIINFTVTKIPNYTPSDRADF